MALRSSLHALAALNRAEPAWGVRAQNELLRQSAIACGLGSDFVGAVLAAAARQIAHAPRLTALIEAWPGDLSAAAVAMRLNAGLHALASRGTVPQLSLLYQQRAGDFDKALRAACQLGEGDLITWMAHPTQTNEVGRAGALMVALMELMQVRQLPCELLELGASAGLNLNLAHYRHQLAGVACGDQGSPVRIAPEWLGPAPRFAPVEVIAARGVDLHPLRLGDAATCERLMAFVWADQDSRAQRLAAAIGLARQHIPALDEDRAGPWLAHQLAAPQRPDTWRVVFHSMFIQYLSDDERRSIMTQLIRAGARATTRRPLAWISLEWRSDRSAVELRLTEWAGGGAAEGQTRTLALCHPYGDWIEWLPAALDRPRLPAKSQRGPRSST